jgi:hypothetical protein
MSVLQRIERKIENMNAMLTRFGVDSALFAQIGDGTLFTTSMRACLACDNGPICTAWLAQASGRVERVPEFCPNAQRFAQAKAIIGAGSRPH